MDLCTVIGTAWWVECVPGTHVGVFVFYNFFLIFLKLSFFKKKRFIAQNISEIHRFTKLRNCSFNQFALVVPRRASDKECTVLGSYEYSSEKQVQRKNTAAVG